MQWLGLVTPVQKGSYYTFFNHFSPCSPHPLQTTLLLGSLCHKYPKSLAWGGRSKTYSPCSLLGCLVSNTFLYTKPFLSAFWLVGQWAKRTCFSNTCSQKHVVGNAPQSVSWLRHQWLELWQTWIRFQGVCKLIQHGSYSAGVCQ